MPIFESDPFVREVGRSIREARAAQGLTQQEVALAAGVATRALHAIEHGRVQPRLDTTQRILSVLGMTLEVVPRSARRMSEEGEAPGRHAEQARGASTERERRRRQERGE